MDAAEYKHGVLGLIFLKYISDAFMEEFNALQAEQLVDPEDKDEYLADNTKFEERNAVVDVARQGPELVDDQK